MMTPEYMTVRECNELHEGYRKTARQTLLTLLAILVTVMLTLATTIGRTVVTNERQDSEIVRNTKDIGLINGKLDMILERLPSRPSR
uniref:Uncharacterized protein n=1 Tax=viral metagenome TaxID=1070528 RepID=A0A6M3KC78_9ZZZZ